MEEPPEKKKKVAEVEMDIVKSQPLQINEPEKNAIKPKNEKTIKTDFKVNIDYDS